MRNLIFNNTTNCEINPILTHCAIILTFIVSFFLFRFYINKNKTCHTYDTDEILKRSELYLNRFRSDNEDFFFGTK
jgi:hypothetical protein